MLTKLKTALFFCAGSRPTAEEIETAKALELKNMLNVRMRNARAFVFTNAPEPTEVICGKITDVIKRTYPNTPIVTLDGSAPAIIETGNVPAEAAKSIDDMTVDELNGYVTAHSYDITGFGSMNKAAKVEAIKAHEEALTNPAPTPAQAPAPATTSNGW